MAVSSVAWLNARPLSTHSYSSASFTAYSDNGPPRPRAAVQMRRYRRNRRRKQSKIDVERPIVVAFGVDGFELIVEFLQLDGLKSWKWNSTCEISCRFSEQQIAAMELGLQLFGIMLQRGSQSKAVNFRTWLVTVLRRHNVQTSAMQEVANRCMVLGWSLGGLKLPLDPPVLMSDPSKFEVSVSPLQWIITQGLVSIYHTATTPTFYESSDSWPCSVWATCSADNASFISWRWAVRFDLKTSSDLFAVINGWA
jgi:hypothetical protein